MARGEIDVDARGLIREAYRIEGIVYDDCRTIFLDWMIGLPAETDQKAAIAAALDHYAAAHPDHPMSAVLREGLEADPEPRRRGGRSGRGAARR